MSYSIIFETKFIKLSDGRLLHLDRSGCNNDDAGRNLSDFIGKIYTEDELKKHVEHYMENGKPKENDGFELKIGSKYATYYDYGEHLLRMAKRAKPFEDFSFERRFSADRYDGVELIKPEKKVLSPKEFDDCFYELLYSGKPFSYSIINTHLKDETEIVNALEDKQHVSFYVGKKY